MSDENKAPEEQRAFIKAGWYRDIPNEEYHRSNGTSSSSLKTLLEQTPAHLEYNRTHPKDSTENMKLGTLVHMLVLEPDKFEEEYIIVPDMSYQHPTTLLSFIGCAAMLKL